jgi:hypothetical protein
LSIIAYIVLILDKETTFLIGKFFVLVILHLILIERCWLGHYTSRDNIIGKQFFTGEPFINFIWIKKTGTHIKPNHFVENLYIYVLLGEDNIRIIV